MQVYCQPLFESYDCQFGNILAPVWCFRNTMVRLVCRTLFIVVACFIACLLPFFGDMSQTMVPVRAYTHTYKIVSAVATAWSTQYGTS